MTDLILGIDAGLTTTTAVLFTPTGREVAEASRETPTDQPATGHREVALDVMWDTVAETITAVLESTPVSPDAIRGVGIAGHGHGLYLLDEDGTPVRPGIKSTDSRATELVDDWEADGTAATIRERLGYAPFAADPISLVGWLDRYEPETIDRIETLLFCKDYLKYRLTDELCTDEMEASVFYGRGTESYDRDLIDDLDIGVSAEILPPVVPSWEICGHVTEHAATDTGLTAGTPVASGLHDVGATALGTGAHRAGQSVFIVGTWGQSIVVLDDPWAERGDGTDGDDGDETAPGLTRRYLDGGYLRYKGLRSAAVCLDWFTDEVGAEWDRRADASGLSEYEVYDRVVADVPAGAEGLLFHPYLDGSTDNPTDKAGFYGLMTDHTKAHMLRAVYEGVAISQSARLAELTADMETTDIRFGGGGARSEVWSDIFAAAMDEQLLVPTGDEAGARGAAICGALAADLYPDHTAAVDAMVSIDRRHTPDAEAATIYRDRRTTFEEALDAIRPTWKRLTTTTETTRPND